MSKINFPKKQEQRLIPKYLLEYTEELVENHPDPSADWGGGSGGSPIEAGEGIVITGTDTKTISVDTETIPTVAELSTVAFSGSYSDLSNKPDLSVYELKEDAFTGDYDDLTNKPDLSIYELKSQAFSGNYNDLYNKPTIPTKTSDLNNDSGFITSSDLSGYATETYVNTAISQEWPVIELSPVYPSAISQDDLTALVDKWPKVLAVMDDRYFVPSKYNLNQYTFVLVDAEETSLNPNYKTTHYVDKAVIYEYTGDVTYFSYDIDNDYTNLVNKPDLSIYAESANLATVATTGNYNDLTNKPTIPTVDYPVTDVQIAGVSCVNNKVANIPAIPDMTNYYTKTEVDDIVDNVAEDIPEVIANPATTTATLNSILINGISYAISGGSTPSNMVTTDTTQDITGEKTFVGEKRIKFKQSTSTNKLGFTLYNSGNQEKGYLEYNPSDNGMYLGRYGTTRVDELGFKTSTSSSNVHKLLVPNVTLSGTVTDYIPVSVNNNKADSNGNISLTIPDAVSGTNDGTNWTTLTIGSDTYSLAAGGSGTTVIANPTLVGDEPDLSGIQIGTNKYKIPSGGGSGGTANLFLHNFKIALQYSSSLTIYLEASLITKSSTQILTVSELITQIAALQATAYDDSVIGILYGQHYKSSGPSNKQNILGFGLTGNAGAPNLYLVVPGGNQTSSLSFWSTSSITKTINWVNNVQNARGYEISASCSDLVTPAIV